ncbi:MAG TPA: metallophosphoesterase [Acidimicrobiales bacterium]|nr:metallophosphoesterase [Acidimicrobiales bacterium]
MPDVEPEVTTVGDDFAVVFWGGEWKRYPGLEPDTDHTFDGVSFRTLRRPPGERLATVATVNDVHFGETICGYESNMPDAGPTFSSLPGEPPYPETMNGAAVEEIAAVDPDAVIVKGDLTNDGLDDEYEAFLRCYRGAFGDRMHHIRGNHDAYRGQTYAPEEHFCVDVPGARLAVLDTTVPFAPNGGIELDQLEWLDDLASDADRPVLVFGHHHPWAPGSKTRSATYFGINPDDSEKLVSVAARHRSIAGYFAGHTHRNRVRRFADTGPMPWVEVACVKDFPGAWAEYRIFEGGILQLVHRIRRADALVWTERTRGMFDGLYPGYAFGGLEDRCFVLPAR